MYPLSEYARPWKLFSLLFGIGLLILGAVSLNIPDWDIPISIIMAILTYFTAPWSLRVLLERKWRSFPLALFLTWLSIDGSYYFYWSYKNPHSLFLRKWNFLLSLSLYGWCGLLWLYKGSLFEIYSDVSTTLKRISAWWFISYQHAWGHEFCESKTRALNFHRVIQTRPEIFCDWQRRRMSKDYFETRHRYTNRFCEECKSLQKHLIIEIWGVPPKEGRKNKTPTHLFRFEREAKQICCVCNPAVAENP